MIVDIPNFQYRNVPPYISKIYFSLTGSKFNVHYIQYMDGYITLGHTLAGTPKYVLTT